MKRIITDNLNEWKHNNSKMPYILIGARQVGKTYVIEEFCKKEFSQYVYVNLEYEENIRQIFEETLNSEEIVEAIGILKNIKIIAEETAIFIDEIQVSERAITSLKYFNESKTNYNVLCAGSLLGVALNRFKGSFPVGKVYRNYLYPFNFQEFLWGIGEELLERKIAEAYRDNKALMEGIHKKSLGLYRDYLFVGGMPASVNDYIEHERNLNLYDGMVKRRILDDYMDDMSKYTTTAENQKVRKVFRSLAKQLGQESKFNYKTIDDNGSKRKYESSIEWLINSKIVYSCKLVERASIPLSVYENEKMFKLYVADTGLLMTLAGMTAADLISSEANLYKGMLTENYIAQTFVSNDIPLHYWKSKHNAEIDFIMVRDGLVIPIEVKASTNTKSKSLKVYREKYEPKLAIKISANNFNESNGVRSVPLYAAYMIK